MTSKLRHLDLCSGIGGFSLGLEATGGVKTVAFCEREAYPQAILKQHWPDVPCYKDVKELTYDQLQADGLVPIGLLTAGYPCQPFSVAGKQKGADDPRHLWPDIFRLVKECRPPIVLFENVEGHIRLGLDEVWSNLEDEGYAVRTFNLPAAGVGAPHRRNRIWIVGFNLAFTDSERLHGCEEEGHHYNLNRMAEDELNDRDELRGETDRRGDPRSTAVANPNLDGAQRYQPQEGDHRGTLETGEVEQFWETDPSTLESGVGRMAHGIPKRVDRVKALGNAIVPQIAYLLGVALLNTLREIPK